MNKKRLILTSVISITLIAILMVSTTYSIFTSTEVDENTNVYKTGNLDITYTLSSDNIKLENSVPMDSSSSIGVKPYRITVTNNGTVPYMFDLILEDTTATNVINYDYIMVQVGKLEPVSLSSCTDNIIRKDIIVPASDSATIDVRIWVSDTVQNTEIGKAFYAKLSIDGLAVYNNNAEIDNTILIAKRYLASHLMTLYNDGSTLTTVNIGEEVRLNTNQNIMLDNNGEYRYYGATPNNYVKFNDELWRIISAVKVFENENDSVLEYRVKIVRDESIGEYSWDSNAGYGVSDWTQADLMTELNTLYYNQQSGICYIDKYNETTACDFTNIGLDIAARNLIDDTLWYIGEIPEGYGNGSFTNFYLYERDGDTWVGKVGLIYASDYAFATDYNVCSLFPNSWSGNDGCANNNWLRYGDINNGDKWQWTITPYGYYDSGLEAYNVVIAIYDDGLLSYDYTAYGTGYVAVRPVVYLKSNVIVSSGNGTKNDPYLLELN